MGLIELWIEQKARLLNWKTGCSKITRLKRREKQTSKQNRSTEQTARNMYMYRMVYYFCVFGVSEGKKRARKWNRNNI